MNNFFSTLEDAKTNILFLFINLLLITYKKKHNLLNLLSRAKNLMLGWMFKIFIIKKTNYLFLYLDLRENAKKNTTKKFTNASANYSATCL